jgi:hypothetical protein
MFRFVQNEPQRNFLLAIETAEREFYVPRILKLTDFESEKKISNEASHLTDKSTLIKVDEVILFTYLVLLRECVYRFKTDAGFSSFDQAYPLKVNTEGFPLSSTVVHIRSSHTVRDLCSELAIKLNIPLQEQKNYHLFFGGMCPIISISKHIQLLKCSIN